MGCFGRVNLNSSVSSAAGGGGVRVNLGANSCLAGENVVAYVLLDAGRWMRCFVLLGTVAGEMMVLTVAACSVMSLGLFAVLCST